MDTTYDLTAGLLSEENGMIPSVLSTAHIANRRLKNSDT